VQVRIMVARLAEAKEDALERVHTQLAENARLQVVLLVFVRSRISNA
jgi:hypothetical protein